MSYTVEQFMSDSGVTRAEVDEAKARMLEEMRVYELKEARKSRNLTQKQLAKNMGVSQKRVSILESGAVEHVEVSTLKRYLEGIGGTLQIMANLPDGQRLQLV